MATAAQLRCEHGTTSRLALLATERSALDVYIFGTKTKCHGDELFSPVITEINVPV